MLGRLIVAALLALTLTASAAAATLDDLRAQGYTVAKASDCDAGKDETGATVWKTIWHVSGFGNSTYMSECDPGFQQAVDNWADPVLNFERRWQHEHPDQLQAASEIAAKCYAIGRTAPATDSWRILGVEGSGVSLTVAGADLVALAKSLPNARAADGSCTAQSQIVPGTGPGGAAIPPGTTPVTAPRAPTAPTEEEQKALLAAAVEVEALVEKLEGTGNDAESIRLANAILG